MTAIDRHAPDAIYQGQSHIRGGQVHRDIECATVITTSCTAAEARALTARITASVEQVYRLLLEAYERQVWVPLGYSSWRAYAQNELRVGQSHVYRLLDQGRVIRAIEEAAGVSPLGEIAISERDARDIKPHLDAVTQDIHDRVEAGEAPAVVVKDVIETRRTAYLHTRKRDDRPNRYIGTIAMSVSSMVAADEDTMPVDVAALGAECIPGWIEDLRQGARFLTRLADRLERNVRVDRGGDVVGQRRDEDDV